MFACRLYMLLPYCHTSCCWLFSALVHVCFQVVYVTALLPYLLLLIILSFDSCLISGCICNCLTAIPLLLIILSFDSCLISGCICYCLTGIPMLLIILSIGSCLISGGIWYCLIAIPPVVDYSEYLFMFDFRWHMLLPYCHTSCRWLFWVLVHVWFQVAYVTALNPIPPVVDYSEYWVIFDFRLYMLLSYCHTPCCWLLWVLVNVWLQVVYVTALLPHLLLFDYSEYWFTFDFRLYMLLPYCHTSCCWLFLVLVHVWFHVVYVTALLPYLCCWLFSALVHVWF